MDKSTFESLHHRLVDIELQIGDKDDGPTHLVSAIAYIYEKLSALYTRDSHLHNVEKIFQSVKSSRLPKEHAQSDISDAEKQEQVLIQYPEIRKAYNYLVELLTLQIPLFSSEVYDGMDMAKAKHYQNDLETLYHNFYMLVLKNILVCEKYMALLERENDYWINIEKRFTALKLRLDAVENTTRFDPTY